MSLQFSKKTLKVEKAGEAIGYLCSYFFFTTTLFFILSFLHKIPASWTYLHVALFTISISAFGIGLRRFLYGSGKAIF